MAHSSGPDLAALLEVNRDLEAQLQTLRHEAAELKRQAAEREEQLKRSLASTRDAQRRLRYYEHDEGEEMLLFVARRLMDTWGAKTQRRVLLATKATYAELLPLVTRAVLTPTRPCSFAGAIGLRELTIELDDGRGPTYVQSDLAKWAHLTGLTFLKIGPMYDYQQCFLDFEFPASISNLASLLEMHMELMGTTSATGLHHLTALRQLTSLQVVNCELMDFEALPVLPSLQVLHVEAYRLPGMQHLARQPYVTKLQVVSLIKSQHYNSHVVEHLSVLTGLQDLALCGCLGDRGLESLTPLTGLTQLGLQGAAVTSLQPLTALAQLRVLNLSESSWSGLGPIAHLSALEHLDISHGHEELDVAPLMVLTGLKTINITGSWLENEETLAGMPQLTVIGHPRHDSDTEDESGDEGAASEEEEDEEEEEEEEEDDDNT